jgi:hypothetical protein
MDTNWGAEAGTPWDAPEHVAYNGPPDPGYDCASGCDLASGCDSAMVSANVSGKIESAPDSVSGCESDRVNVSDCGCECECWCFEGWNVKCWSGKRSRENESENER